jgi:hypothetical protein
MTFVYFCSFQQSWSSSWCQRRLLSLLSCHLSIVMTFAPCSGLRLCLVASGLETVGSCSTCSILMICCDQNGHSAVGGCCCCLGLGRRCLVHLTDLCYLQSQAHVNGCAAFAASSLDGCDVFLNWSCRHVYAWVHSLTSQQPGLKQPCSKSCWAGSDWIHSF